MRTTAPSTTSCGSTRPSWPISFLASAIRSSSELSQSPSPSKQKYSIPRHVRPRSGTIALLQLLKFWMRPTLTPGVWM